MAVVSLKNNSDRNLSSLGKTLLIRSSIICLTKISSQQNWHYQSRKSVVAKDGGGPTACDRGFLVLWWCSWHENYSWRGANLYSQNIYYCKSQNKWVSLNKLPCNWLSLLSTLKSKQTFPLINNRNPYPL